MAKLEEIHADTSPDIRLRLDVGQVAETLEEWDRCDRALGGALAEAPDDPRAIAAYFSRGICLAKLGRPKEEIEAYDAYLARETDLDARAVAFYDRGDAQMLLAQDNPSRLALAINDYRTALLLRPELSSAHWGLAVALDRSGDAPGAIAAAKNALIFDPLEQQISPENRAVFFVPAYDQYWYEGLSAMARAQQPETRASPATSLLLLETAVAKWSNFIAAASRDDRWVPLAKSHLTSSQRQLDQARKRHTRSPNGRRPRADDVDP
jgi:tetratricopeptide (TPR) repeat protein